MHFKNLMFLTVLALFVLAACGDKKKEEAEKDPVDQMKIEREKIEAAILKTEDSLRQIWADSMLRDSITKDSLRQVKEHGHAH